MVDAHPEWWVIPLAAVLGAVVIVHGIDAERPRSLSELVHHAGHWALMAIVMMLPTVRAAARLAARATLFSRRRATVGWYVAGFSAPWALYGIAVAALSSVLPAGARGAVWSAAFALAALGWQGSAARRREMSRCSPVPALPLRGWEASRRTAASGAEHGRRCVYTCWASMLLMVASPHPATMGALMGIHAYERRSGPNPFASHRWRAPAVAYGALAAVALLSPVL